MHIAESAVRETLRTLPGDDARQIMWRFAERWDLQMLAQSTRSVARGTIARMVADGLRNSHEWTPEKARMLAAFDESGITAAFLDPANGGYIEGPKNLALALVAFELAWVDAGAATCSLAGNLALSPIHERGTEEQRNYYEGRCAPAGPGEERPTWRGAFALTEPLPFVGVDTGVVSGRVRVAEWKEGEEPILEVSKRGRFITNMGFANFVTAAVDSGDPRIKGSCMVILEEGDPGTFDRGAPTLKLVHQLSSTSDPIFNLRVPAHRIIGGYTVKDGVIIPRYNHSEVIEAVFRRTRVTVAIMTAAKLLSAVEPVIRYQRGRFRGGEGQPGTPRYELGLQQKEDALHRLVDVWATGEAAASLGFEAARLFDRLDPLEKEKDAVMAAQGVSGGRAQLKVLRKAENDAHQFLRLSAQPEGERDAARYAALAADPIVQYSILDSVANVLCPACKLWNTGFGATMMREAVSLMGGYGITQDCPGFLAQKWMDAQLEATYEGPEAVQRRQMSITMTNPLFLGQFRQWAGEMRTIASARPGTGACTLATAMSLWLWSVEYLQKAKDAQGNPLFHSSRQGVTFPLADALAWLLSARSLILDVMELEEKGPQNPVVAEGLAGLVGFYTDLCHVHAARASGEVGRICAELVFGYHAHPAWAEAGCRCFLAEELEELESVAPGFASVAWPGGDVVEGGGRHVPKAGPCVRFSGMEAFARLRTKLDGCLTGARLAKDRAAMALTTVMIPEALDYPQ
ncbi:acyl-CoA/acyl-ACP dehydrogenase [bacterium]|nr:acyl-CoA/acyl-ACP dehydrogenase [bacterium]